MMYCKFTETEYAELISTLNGAKQSISQLKADKARLEQDVVELKQQVEKWENRYVSLVHRFGASIED